uniref:Uncharacterized protein n=1 Tax=Romanomermis culicivorax TaxID=13658 RepID=A0A915JWZ5_ROMCU
MTPKTFTCLGWIRFFKLKAAYREITLNLKLNRNNGNALTYKCNFHTYNDDERFKHAEMFKNYTRDYDYLKGQLFMYCIMSKNRKT